jgi:putative peptide zinc metalloprotease protein
MDISDTPGKFFDTGEEICTVQEVRQLRIKGTIDQEDAQLVIGYKPTEAAPQAKTEIRLVSDVATTQSATGYRVVPGASQELPHPALAAQNGGSVTLDPKDQTGTKSQSPEFQLWVDMANPNNELIPGQRAYVRMTVDRRPLAWQWTRDLLQLIQSRKERGNELAKY